MMDTDEKQELNPPSSILHRLDRLLRFLEEKQCLSAKHSVKSQDQCMSLSSALEEVHHKGTLMERVALLENRVLQLSLDMEMGNTSRSSSSTSSAAEKPRHESEGKWKNEDINMIIPIQNKQDSLITQDSVVAEACSLNSPSCRAGRSRRRRNRRSTLRFTKLAYLVSIRIWMLNFLKD